MITFTQAVQAIRAFFTTHGRRPVAPVRDLTLAEAQRDIREFVAVHGRRPTVSEEPSV